MGNVSEWGERRFRAVERAFGLLYNKHNNGKTVHKLFFYLVNFFAVNYLAKLITESSSDIVFLLPG